MAKITKISIVAALIAAAASGPLAAQAMPTRVTAKALSAVCAENRAACLTYVLGAIDGVVATSMVGSGRQPLCLPRQGSNDQLAQTVFRYLKAHPEQGNANGATIVVVALLEAHPCPRR